MRDHSHHIQLTREEAVRQMLAALDGLPGGFGWTAADSAPHGGDADGERASAHRREVDRKLVERVAVGDSFGRALAYDVRARASAPTCLTCALDSVAVHWDAFDGLAEGEVPDISSWQRGRDWEFANTGTAMPEGFDTAIVVEHVCLSDDGERLLTIDAAPSRRYAGTRPEGSTMKRGDTLATAGTVVTPDIAARIASGNVSTVAVVRPPRVAFIPTGDELQTPGSPFVARGKNVETNSILARGKIESWGGEFIGFQTIRDRPAAIRYSLREACEMADIVVLNAGSSKGSGDWSCEVMEEIGHMVCHQTNHGPGHHSSYALIDGTPVVGISGPAGGASPTMTFYLRPLIRRFLGLDPAPRLLSARLAAPFPVKGHRGSEPQKPKLAGEDRPLEDSPDGFFAIRFLNVSVGADGTLEATPVAGGPGSPTVIASNAWYMMPTGRGCTPPAPGDIIPVEFR